MNKETAVEWFVKELFKKIDYIQVDPKLIEQALAMEKENIIESMGIAFIDALTIQEGKKSLYKDWEHYYNQTYGGDK
jgi:hypothetical protein